jgi:predicted transcriptional regulator
MRVKEHLTEHPVDRGRVEAHKRRMLAEVRGQRLRELREGLGLTQAQLAESIGVGARLISRIERGDLDGVRIGTLRAHAAALGADLSVSSVMGDAHTRIG